MKSTLVIGGGVMTLAAVLLAQKEMDWGAFFHKGPFRTDAEIGAFWENAQPMINRLMTEAPDIATKDVLQIAERFDDKDATIRTSAFGLMYMITQLRNDSATVLIPVLPKIQEHFLDPADEQLRWNAIMSVGALKPAVPGDQVTALLKLSKADPKKREAALAMFGIARAVNENSDALSWVDEQLAKQTPLTEATLTAVANSHLYNKQVAKRLSELLSPEKSPETLKTMLQTLAALPTPAIEACAAELNTLVSHKDKEISDTASSLLKRL
jgi:hypothetical protein